MVNLEGFQVFIYIGLGVLFVNMILSILFWLMVYRVYKHVPNIYYLLEEVRDNQKKMLRGNKSGRTERIKINSI